MSAPPASATAPRPVLGMVLGFVGVVIFGGTLPFTKLALEDLSPGFVTFGRATVAGLLAGAILLALGRRFPRGDGWRLAVAAVALIYAFPGCVAIAMTTLPANHGAVMLAVTPLTTAAFATVIAGERPSRAFWVWAVLGAAVVLVFALDRAGGGFAPGHLWLLGAALATSFGYVIFGQLSRRIPGWEVICWALVLAWPVSALGTALSWRPEFLEADAPAVAGFLYASFFSMFLGFFAWNAGMALGGIARVGQVQLMQVFVTILLSVPILGEEVSLRTAAFAAAVAGIVWMGRRAKVGEARAR